VTRRRTIVCDRVLYWRLKLGRLCYLDQIAVSDRGDSGVYHNRYHNSCLRAQPLACKLLILKTRRDVRVVEGARLESVCRGNSTVGSNPTLSANTLK
jgi:hypothetical protein